MATSKYGSSLHRMYPLEMSMDSSSSACEHLRGMFNGSMGEQYSEHLRLGVKWAVRTSHPSPTTSSSSPVPPLTASADPVSSKAAKAAADGKSEQLKSANRAQKNKQARIQLHPKCSTCSKRIPRPFLCLDCGYVLCGDFETGARASHASQHSIKAAHSLFLDLRSKSTYCATCQDYVYHPITEKIISTESRLHDESLSLSSQAPSSSMSSSSSSTPGSSSTSPSSSSVSISKKRSTSSTGERNSKQSVLGTKVPPPSPIQHQSVSYNEMPRGLRNLGQTCYMSVILQAFLHNPLLRRYFLSDRHNRELCSSHSQSRTPLPLSANSLSVPLPATLSSMTNVIGVGKVGVDRSNRSSHNDGKPCIGCEFDRLFSEMYSTGALASPSMASSPSSTGSATGNTSANSPATAFGPTHFLHSFWKCNLGRLGGEEMTGYAQQDAHEFLISTLNLLHSSTPGTSDRVLGFGECPCIVHSSFSGQLKSQVVCGSCGHSSISTDPFLDLSLGLVTNDSLASGPSSASTPISQMSSSNHNIDLADGVSKKMNGGIEGKMSSTNGFSGNVEEQKELKSTLANCLKRFTSPEQLGQSGYTCTSCGVSAATASKRLSINKLPPILCIQFKRFEHKSGSHKIDTPVQFPLRLNMHQYTSSALEANHNMTSSASFSPPSPLSSSKDDFAIEQQLEYLSEYDLSAVICHEGQISNGHYYVYTRVQDDFYCFDDEKVRRTTIEEVLASKAYLLLYIQRTVGFGTL